MRKGPTPEEGIVPTNMHIVLSTVPSSLLTLPVSLGRADEEDMKIKSMLFCTVYWVYTSVCWFAMIHQSRRILSPNNFTSSDLMQDANNLGFLCNHQECLMVCKIVGSVAM